MLSPDPLAIAPQRRAKHRRVWGALLRKEWREQRWRFFLGTMVLSGLLGGMLRAQIIPPYDAAVLIYWPVGVLMVIFLAMAPVASERTGRTWEFLIARPVRRADVLLSKWAMGLIQLIGMMAIATGIGLLALRSRSSLDASTLFVLAVPDTLTPASWVRGLAVTATGALACWYTTLFFVLARARNEFAAALGGILLTVAVHAWLAQFFVLWLSPLFVIPAHMNPLAPLAVTLPWTPYLLSPYGLVLLNIPLWLCLPVWAAWYTGREGANA
jgi:hypothetical protein